MTVAAFMDLALYHPHLGYYTRAPRRSGRAGDFFTSVDVGPLYGELLADELAEMADLVARTVEPPLESAASWSARSAEAPAFDLVEAGAGDGRLAADILRRLRASHPTVYERTRLHLVEASAAARRAQPATLGEVADRLTSSGDSLPDQFAGVLLANELIDAMPVHQVVMREDGLREVYVVSDCRTLITREGPPSTPALAALLDRLRVELEPGWRAEINLRAIGWIREALRRLETGFMVLVDYGHAATELYSAAHAGGTLTTFSQHLAEGAEAKPGSARWLQRPGEQDITSHVDFTSLRAEVELAGADVLAFLDQTYFLMGLASARAKTLDQRQRLALKTLVMPGGLGSTMKVLIAGKGMGNPSLSCCSFRVRAT